MTHFEKFTDLRVWVCVEFAGFPIFPCAYIGTVESACKTLLRFSCVLLRDVLSGRDVLSSLL